MTCQVCGYHAGPLERGHQACPRVHLYRPWPTVAPHRDGCLCCLCAERVDEEVPASGFNNIPDDPDTVPVERCRDCGGTGMDRGDDLCGRCWGSGEGE